MRIWYWSVRQRTSLSDYALDLRFVGNPRKAASGANPPRAFERIRKFGMAPSTGNHRMRDFDLVDRVEADADFHGTARIYRSRFWQLIKTPDISLPSLSVLIEELLETLQLYRPNHLEAAEILGKETWTLDNPGSFYRASLLRVASIGKEGGSALDRAALLGALFREAVLEGEYDLLPSLKTAFMRAIALQQDLLREIANCPHLTKWGEIIASDATRLGDLAIQRVLSPIDKSRRVDAPNSISTLRLANTSASTEASSFGELSSYLIGRSRSPLFNRQQ